MIEHLQGLPKNIVGFKATGDITQKDFTETVLPKVQEQIDKTGKLNYLLVLETSLKNFTMGAWVQDALLGIKHITQWHRAAIVSDKEGIRNFTDLFGKFMPGEFKGFEHKDLQQAIDWVAAE